MTGFRPYLEKGVDVSINAVRRVNPSLQLGPVTESVTVEASAAILQTTKADVNVNLETRAMENLPLSNYRNYQTLINLVVAVVGERQVLHRSRFQVHVDIRLRPRSEEHTSE